MNRQKFAVFIVAIIGMIATFLPWYGIDKFGTVSGMSSSGWFTFIMFALVLLFGLRKNLKEEMSMGMIWGTSILSMLAACVVLWQAMDVFFAKEGIFSIGDQAEVALSQMKVMYGAWIVMLAGIGIPLVAIAFKKPRYTTD